MPALSRRIRQLAQEKIHNDLATLLTGLELTPAATREIVRLVLDRASRFQLGHSASTAQLDHLLYVNLTSGLKVLSLDSGTIHAPVVDLSCVALIERCQKGRLMASHNNLLLTIHPKDEKAEKSRPTGQASNSIFPLPWASLNLMIWVDAPSSIKEQTTPLRFMPTNKSTLKFSPTSHQ